LRNSRAKLRKSRILKTNGADIEAKLTALLRNLEVLLGFPKGELRVRWEPQEGAAYDGEVRGRDVIIRDKDPEAAEKTLHHELLDLALTRYETPWRDLCRVLIENFTKTQYKRKEDLVERLVKMLR